MKKNIDYVEMNAGLASWLLNKLKSAPSGINDIEELAKGVENLIDGSVSTLMLEINDDFSSAPKSGIIRAGQLSIYPKARKVIRDSAEISLTPKEFDILYFLAKNRGEVFTKEQIYQAVWDEEYLLDDSNIMAFIRKLRKKIEPNPDAPEYIITIWGIGYKFRDKEI